MGEGRFGEGCLAAAGWSERGATGRASAASRLGSGRFSLPTPAFSLPTPAFSLPTPAFSLPTPAFLFANPCLLFAYPCLCDRKIGGSSRSRQEFHGRQTRHRGKSSSGGNGRQMRCVGGWGVGVCAGRFRRTGWLRECGRERGTGSGT